MGCDCMLFISLKFICFLVLTLVIYYCIPKKYRYLVLLIASYYYYGINNFVYLIILLVITLISYFSGYFVNKLKTEKEKKEVIFFNVLISLFILIYFKYFNIFISSIEDIVGNVLNIEKIIVPLGISFFILQSITYPIDVYRKQVKLEKNIFKFALFVSFFPQIASGPIGKSKEMLPQFNKEHEYSDKNIYIGFMLILYGFFQKLVIADLIAVGVNNVYGNLGKFTGLPLFFTVFLYSFQIYFDFCSYSNIALGCGKLFGYDLINNFKSPYFADSIKAFWSRWHISLSTWFKEYLYIPLGGNRCSTYRIYFNLMIVFLASGLWHGTSYTYIIWGFIHGMYQIIERIINRKCKFKIVNVLITFVLVTFAWIFFRANSLSDAFYVFCNMFDLNLKNILVQIKSIGFDNFDLLIMLFGISFVLIIEYFFRNKDLLSELYSKQNIIKYIIFLIIFFVVIIFGCYGPGFNNSEFIYLGY